MARLGRSGCISCVWKTGFCDALYYCDWRGGGFLAVSGKLGGNR